MSKEEMLKVVTKGVEVIGELENLLDQAAAKAQQL
tara:strand:+ start:560 stop:664 length:105 start_codon:yes stop_codon:yes gene_type:complete